MNSRLFGLFFVGIFLFQSLVLAASSVLAPSGLEATLTYEARVLLPKSLEPNRANIRSIVNEQGKHLLGVFSSPGFTKSVGGRKDEELGVLALGSMIAFDVLGQKKTPEGTEISYKSRHKVIIRDRLLQPYETKSITLYLPYSPAKIYARECTDSHYYSKEDFFYFWDPLARGCPPKLIGRNAVEVVEGTVRGLVPPPAQAQPDYKRLAAQIRQQGELRVSVLIGFDESYENPRDLGRKSYRYFQDFFDKKGFEVVKEGIAKRFPYTELFREANDKRPAVRLMLSLSESGGRRPVVFAQRVRYALENSDIVLYAGHSNLGGSLDLEAVAAVSSPDPSFPIPIRFPNKYQIFYFDGCSSYYFYAEPYAFAKGGARHVDVVTNGLASYFLSQNEDIRIFLKSFFFLDAFLEPKGAPTWLDILTALEKAPGPTYLVNVIPIR